MQNKQIETKKQEYEENTYEKKLILRLKNIFLKNQHARK